MKTAEQIQAALATLEKPITHDCDCESCEHNRRLAVHAQDMLHWIMEKPDTGFDRFIGNVEASDQYAIEISA